FGISCRSSWPLTIIARFARRYSTELEGGRGIDAASTRDFDPLKPVEQQVADAEFADAPTAAAPVVVQTTAPRTSGRFIGRCPRCVARVSPRMGVRGPRGVGAGRYSLRRPGAGVSGGALATSRAATM